MHCWTVGRWCGSVLWIASGRLLETNGQSQVVQSMHSCRMCCHQKMRDTRWSLGELQQMP
ncbi:unnamed protein product [Cladocopium goreaui]|uniref:Uncharacterized protein n=1 Tax=Cladocopium goreaui TaxID=2562237 RepID=A0A9P1BQI2_9DINO|nr:unnamed protein product [Cladocopium goreaui]